MGSLLARVDQPLMKDAYKAKLVFMWVYGAASGKTSDRGKIYSSFHIYADCGLVTFLEHKHIVYENIALGVHYSMLRRVPSTNKLTNFYDRDYLTKNIPISGPLSASISNCYA